MTNLTVVRAYYENPLTLARHVANMDCWPRTKNLELGAIFVDDGSPVHPAEHVLSILRPMRVPTRLFRVEEDVRWNWLGARNVGMHHAPEGWCLMTDMDLFVPGLLVRWLDGAPLREDTIYTFSRRWHDGRPAHPHPNSWLMTREMFWRIGGFNEAASGYYGTDSSWRRRCEAAAPVVQLSQALEWYEGVDDASTRDYGRKEPEDREGKRILREWGDAPPRVLSFPYHEVELDANR